MSNINVTKFKSSRHVRSRSVVCCYFGSLTDHTAFLTSKITFLLDAMIGFVNIEQNNVIKIFSVVAVVLMPPTLVASIYGMNFRHMPELDWLLGYPMALALMVVAAVLPYVFFKWRKWL